MNPTRLTPWLCGALVLLGTSGCGPDRIEKDDALFDGVRQVSVEGLECVETIYQAGGVS